MNSKGKKSCCEKATGPRGSDRIILAGIAGFTLIVISGLWFASANRAEQNTSISSNQPQQQASDSMAGHHSENESPASVVALEGLIGKPVPPFSFTDRNGGVYNNENLKGKNIILFFNEGLMCYPACWEQIVQLSSDARLNTADTVAVSVVVDPKDDWQQAVDKMPALAKSIVVFDADKNMSQKFNVLTTPSSMHYGSLPGHTYIIIDKGGIVRHTYDDPAMAIHNDQLVQELAKFQ